MENLEWSHMEPAQRLEMLRNAPPNAWLALSEDESRLVGTAPTYDEAVEMAAREGVEDPVLIKTPDDWALLVF